jgi:integrase/recombinase XerD
MAKLTLVEPKVPTALAALVDDFLADVRARGLSIRTSESYEHPLRAEFLPWCAKEHIADPAQLTEKLVGGFTVKLLEQGGKHGALSRASVRTYVRAARVFLAWCEKPDGGAVPVGAKPRLPKREKPLVDVLSRDEIARMEDAAPTERDKLLIRILADTGLRAGELLALTPSDLQEQARGQFFLKVHGKGSRDRVVPIMPALQRRLRRYIAGRRTDKGDRVFVSLRKGGDGRYAPLTTSGLEQAVRIAAQEAGITKRVYPHLLRHSHASNWLRRGGDVVMLQKNLGHADLAMIADVYSHLDASDAYQAAMHVLMGDQ